MALNILMVVAFAIFLDDSHRINCYMFVEPPEIFKRLLSDEIVIICEITLASRLVSVDLSANIGH